MLGPPIYPTWRYESYGAGPSGRYAIESWSTVHEHAWYRIVVQHGAGEDVVVLHQVGDGDPTIELVTLTQGSAGYIDWLKAHLEEVLMQHEL